MLSASVKALRDSSHLNTTRCSEHGFPVLLVLFDGDSYGQWPGVGTLKLGLPPM